MKQKPHSAARLGDLVQKVFAELDKKAVSQEDILSAWSRAAGEGAAHATPVALSRATLRVNVDSSGWMQELNFRKRGVLKKLQCQFGKDKISNIRFRIGDSKPPHGKN